MYLGLKASICLAILVALLLRYLVLTIIYKRRYKFPSVVPGVPIFGNTFQIPPLQQGPWAKKLADKHGEM